MTFQKDSFVLFLLFFLICGQLMRHPLIELFHLSNLLQMLNDRRIVNDEFFGNFLCSYKRISFDDVLSWSLPTSHGWPLYTSSSRLSYPLQNFLNHRCTVRSLAVPRPNAFAVDVESCLCYFTTQFELE